MKVDLTGSPWMAAMPIKFRCAYCNQLMGISRRKAGTVVSCPTCRGQIVVPLPEAAVQVQPVKSPMPVPGPTRGSTGGQLAAAQPNVFENHDFDADLFIPSKVSPVQPIQPTAAGADLALDIAKTPLPSLEQREGVNSFATGNKHSTTLLLAAAGLALAAIGFGIGFWAAKAF